MGTALALFLLPDISGLARSPQERSDPELLKDNRSTVKIAGQTHETRWHSSLHGRTLLRSQSPAALLIRIWQLQPSTAYGVSVNRGR